MGASLSTPSIKDALNNLSRYHSISKHMRRDLPRQPYAVTVDCLSVFVAESVGASLYAYRKVSGVEVKQPTQRFLTRRPRGQRNTDLKFCRQRTWPTVRFRNCRSCSTLAQHCEIYRALDTSAPPQLWLDLAARCCRCGLKHPVNRGDPHSEFVS